MSAVLGSVPILAMLILYLAWTASDRLDFIISWKSNSEVLLGRFFRLIVDLAEISDGSNCCLAYGDSKYCVLSAFKSLKLKFRE